MPFLKSVALDFDKTSRLREFPFNIPAIRSIDKLDTNYNVIFFVGENGTGKSTLLESIANKCGFGIKGGGKNIGSDSEYDDLSLEEVMTLSWFPKITNGFFLRAETLFDFAGYIEEMARDPYNSSHEVLAPYGGKSLYGQSHGESFMSLFKNRFNSRGIYLLDEPEAALSTQRQFEFLRILHELDKGGKAQFIIATHSPIIMAYPGAVIYSFDNGEVKEVRYEDTEHYQLTRYFLNNREKFLEDLLGD